MIKNTLRYLAEAAVVEAYDHSDDVHTLFASNALNKSRASVTASERFLAKTLLMRIISSDRELRHMWRELMQQESRKQSEHGKPISETPTT